MDTTDKYFDVLCRACMNELFEAASYDDNTKPQQWLSIFDIIEEECGSLQIGELLTNAVPQIKVQLSDELPKRICSKCLQQLLSVNRFQQMCLQSEEQLRQLLAKKQTSLNIPGAAMEGEIGTHNADSYPCISSQPSSTQQNLEHTSKQKSLVKTKKRVVKPEATETSDGDHWQNIDESLEYSRDSPGNFSEIIKNEPIEDDERSIECSDGETTISAVSVKGEELSIEFEEEQISDANVKANRIIHERIHSDEKAHKCDFCEKSFANNWLLRIHIRKHTGEKPYKCKYCQRSFSQSWNRLKHMRLHLGDNVHRCELCPLAFPAASELHAHFTTHENEDPETRERNMKALKEAEAELEIKAEENVEKHKCPHCPQRFSNYENMLQHKAIHKRARINCDICGKSIRNNRLKEHKRIHSGEKPHKCHLCEKSFTKKANLPAHIRSHTGEKPFKCKYCERSYFQNKELMKHMRLHLGDNVHRCKLCPLAFPAASELRAHFTTHKKEYPETRERNMKALKEAEAELELKAKENVKKHHSRHAEDDKPYKCTYCRRKFNTISNMNQHKARHEVACDICGKTIVKSCLKIHKLTHSNEKAHKCDFCGKRFNLISYLRKHIRTHTGEKPYKCKYCERSFSDWTGHRKHMRIYHGDNIHRCKLCPLAFPLAKELRAHLTEHDNDDSETRERNMKALKEAEVKLQLELSKKHIQEAPKCDFCGKCFTVMSALRQHMRIHTGTGNDDSETRERNMKALKEAETKLELELSETETQQPSKE